MSPSDHARSILGKTMLLSVNGGPSREVVIKDVRASASTIEDMDTGQQWPGIQYLCKPTDGGRAFWSRTFPDKEAAINV